MSLSNSDSESDPLKVSSDFIPLRDQLPPGRLTTTDLDGILTRAPLKIVEDLTSGCGGQLWPAGICLAKYLIRRYRDSSTGETLARKRIVELGSGGGVTGLAIGLELEGIGEEGGEFWMTDMQDMIELAEKNVVLNGLEGRVKVGLLDWADPIPGYIARKPVDIILAADCVYFEPTFPLLEKTLIDLATEDTEVLFCYKKRRRADVRFIKSIRKKFVMTEIKDEDYGTYSRDSIFLYSMRKKKDLS